MYAALNCVLSQTLMLDFSLYGISVQHTEMTPPEAAESRNKKSGSAGLFMAIKLIAA